MINVVIPAFNEEKFLSECLESLKNQDYLGKYEVILIDNDSKDNTKNIAQKFGVKIVHCSEKGVFYARKRGVDIATGDIIVQGDADTTYPKDWLTEISKQFSVHPDAVAVAGRFIYKDPPYWAKLEYFVRNFINFLALMFCRRPLLISGANFAFRKEIFFKIGGYEKKSLSFDQYDISNRLSKAGKIIYNKRSVVLTSSRRVQKPFLFILLDFVSNFTSIFAYFSKLSSETLSKSIMKSSSLKTSLKLSPLVVLIIFFAYGYFVPSSSVFGKVYYEGDSSEKLIALTFDDGPNEPYTSEILDILNKYNIKATFFVIGENAEIFPETVKRMINEGNVVENHSYSHNANHALTNEGCKDLKIAQETIFKTIGVEPHLYRPPHGKKSPWELECLKKENLIEVEWSDSTNELHSELFFGKLSPALLGGNIIEDAGSGKIILLHDGYGMCHNCKESDKAVTVKALSTIIETLQKQGYKFVTIPQLLGIPAYNKI